MYWSKFGPCKMRGSNLLNPFFLGTPLSKYVPPFILEHFFQNVSTCISFSYSSTYPSHLFNFFEEKKRASDQLQEKNDRVEI